MMSSSLETSQRSAWALPPAASMSRTTVAASSARDVEVSITVQPRSAARRATAAPIPRLPPTTTITLFGKRRLPLFQVLQRLQLPSRRLGQQQRRYESATDTRDRHHRHRRTQWYAHCHERNRHDEQRARGAAEVVSEGLSGT